MLFRKKIERSCAYCANGARLGGGIPPKPKAVDFSKYDNEDFSL